MCKVNLYKLNVWWQLYILKLKANITFSYIPIIFYDKIAITSLICEALSVPFLNQSSCPILICLQLSELS